MTCTIVQRHVLAAPLLQASPRHRQGCELLPNGAESGADANIVDEPVVAEYAEFRVRLSPHKGALHGRSFFQC